MPLRIKVLILSVSLILLSWTLLWQDLVKDIHVLYHISSVTFRYESQVKEKREQGGGSGGILFTEAVLTYHTTRHALKSGCGLVQRELQNITLKSAAHQEVPQKNGLGWCHNCYIKIFRFVYRCPGKKYISLLIVCITGRLGVSKALSPRVIWKWVLRWRAWRRVLLYDWLSDLSGIHLNSPQLPMSLSHTFLIIWVGFFFF